MKLPRFFFFLFIFFSLFTTLVLQSMEFSGKRLEISEKREIYRLFFLPILIFFTYIFTIQKIILNCPAYTFLSKSTILCHEAFKEISNLTRRIIIEEQSKESYFRLTKSVYRISGKIVGYSWREYSLFRCN